MNLSYAFFEISDGFLFHYVREYSIRHLGAIFHSHGKGSGHPSKGI